MRKSYYNDHLNTSKIILESIPASSKSCLLFTGGKESSVLSQILDSKKVDRIFFSESGFSNQYSLSDSVTIEHFKDKNVKIIKDPLSTALSDFQRWNGWVKYLKELNYNVIIAGNRWADNKLDNWELPPQIVIHEETGIIIMYPLAIWSDGHLWQFIAEKQIVFLKH